MRIVVGTSYDLDKEIIHGQIPGLNLTAKVQACVGAAVCRIGSCHDLRIWTNAEYNGRTRSVDKKAPVTQCYGSEVANITGELVFAVQHRGNDEQKVSSGRADLQILC